MIPTAAVLKKWHVTPCLVKPLPSHPLSPSHGYRMMAGRLCRYPKGHFSAQVGKGSQVCLRVLQSCSNTFWERDRERKEQAPTHGLGEPLPEYTGGGPRGHGERQRRTAAPRLGASRVGKASPHTLSATERRFKAARRGDKLNVVQLPAMPHAGRNDL